MPVTTTLTNQQVGKRRKREAAVVTKATEGIVTRTAAMIVTALGDGPCSALALSQRLPGLGHANARQTLRRMALAGVVTRLRRGLYGRSDSATTTTNGSAQKAAKPAVPVVRRQAYSPDQIAAAVAEAWAHFEAMDDPRRPEAWA